MEILLISCIVHESQAANRISEGGRPYVPLYVIWESPKRGVGLEGPPLGPPPPLPGSAPVQLEASHKPRAALKIMKLACRLTSHFPSISLMKAQGRVVTQRG